MSNQRTARRVVILVDGAEGRQGEAHCNPSSIFRLHSLVTDGLTAGASGGNVLQVKRYYTCVGKPPTLVDKFKTKVPGDDTDDKIKQITKEICSILESPQDEVYLFGSGHGSFVARAVAGVMHHMGLPKRESLNRFDDLFDCTCALQRAWAEDDSRNGPRLTSTIQAHTLGPPRIRFMGLLDSIKATATSTVYDTSFVASISHLRVALALNENRSAKAAQLLEIGKDMDMTTHSFVQAWFIGSVDDMCGAVLHDGISLYPLQWMLIEAMKTGLAISAPGGQAPKAQDPMALVFPQYAGNLPNLDGSEDIQWSFKYTNGIQVSMFDLQTVHAAPTRPEGDSHCLRLDNECFSHAPNRKIFGSNGLKGWNSTGAHGTIIHLSAFCILDRFPKYLELSSFKPLKKNLAEYQADCVLDNATSLPPWLQGMQLQASGVKAFRILVCGKTGVGKSTLINKVFGVEMTEESLSYDQGVHDINQAFESPRHPGLLIHDSRGWQAGSDSELELIARFLRNRAFQKDAAQALHVIWFCVDADVSRIEEADKKTFETIAQFSHDVPVFIVGTKKDKLVGYRKMQLLEEYMSKTEDYPTALRLANDEANQSAEDQFSQLRDQLSQIKHYKADGYCCLSKDDEVGIKSLISQTLGLIADERVRLFCVAAQVIDVDQKINSAITECMRLGTHAIRTAAVPLPFSGIITTPTVSRLICEHVLQCFGFPKAAPAEVEAIMTNVVMGNIRDFKQIEDAARYYTTTTIKTFAGNEKRLQQQVHDEIDDLIPLKRLQIGFKFNRLRGNIEDLIYASRFGKPPDYPSSPTNSSTTRLASISAPAELPAPTQRPPVELENTSSTPELPGSEAPTSNSRILSRDSDKVLGSLGDMSLIPRSHRSSASKTAELEARLSLHAPYSPASDTEGKTLIGSPGATLDGSTLGSQHSSDLSPQPSTKSSTKWSRPSWLRSNKSRNFS
ncbi:Nonsense-mediated mRNA decay protein 5 [Pestalotiopsis sp. IQ-011]